MAVAPLEIGLLYVISADNNRAGFQHGQAARYRPTVKTAGGREFHGAWIAVSDHPVTKAMPVTR
jgi:hypothetical protein